MTSETQPIDTSNDLIDSRDIIARIAELSDQRDDWTGSQADWLATDEGHELEALETLAGEAEGYADDWHHGVTLIRDTYFVEYVQDLLVDCGTIPSNLPSWVELDWEATAKNVQVDYTAVELDGITYWVR